jgi:hypothetical protein
MICTACRAGGNISSKIRTGQTTAAAALGRRAAAVRHSECRGGTWCDCQHLVALGVGVASVPAHTLLTPAGAPG